MEGTRTFGLDVVDERPVRDAQQAEGRVADKLVGRGVHVCWRRYATELASRSIELSKRKTGGEDGWWWADLRLGTRARRTRAARSESLELQFGSKQIVLAYVRLNHKAARSCPFSVQALLLSLLLLPALYLAQLLSVMPVQDDERTQLLPDQTNVFVLVHQVRKLIKVCPFSCFPPSYATPVAPRFADDAFPLSLCSQENIDTTLSWDQLNAPDVQYTITRPLVHRFSKHLSPAIGWQHLSILSPSPSPSSFAEDPDSASRLA